MSIILYSFNKIQYIDNQLSYFTKKIKRDQLENYKRITAVFDDVLVVDYNIVHVLNK